MYIDKKNNNENGEDDIYNEDWSDSDTIEVQEDQENTNEQEQYLDEDEYGFQDIEPEKYEARNTEELADI